MDLRAAGTSESHSCESLCDRIALHMVSSDLVDGCSTTKCGSSFLCQISSPSPRSVSSSPDVCSDLSPPPDLNFQTLHISTAFDGTCQMDTTPASAASLLQSPCRSSSPTAVSAHIPPVSADNAGDCPLITIPSPTAVACIQSSVAITINDTTLPVCQSQPKSQLKRIWSEPLPSSDSDGNRAKLSRLRSILISRSYSTCDDSAPRAAKRVRFAELVVSGFMEPNDPLCAMNVASSSDVESEYCAACLRHSCAPAPAVVRQLRALPVTQRGRCGGRLCLRGCQLSLAQCDALEAVLRRVQFSEIDVTDCQLSDVTGAALLDMIGHYRSTLAVALGDNQLQPPATSRSSAAGARTWHALSQLIRHCDALQRVSAPRVPVGERAAAELSRALSAATCQLSELCLDDCGLHGRATLLLATALRSNRSLRRLSLANNRLGAGDACQLGHALSGSRHLHELDLRHNCLGDGGVQQLLRALSEQPQQVCAGGEDDSATTTTSSSSSSQRGLLVLNLWANQFGDECGESVALLLRRHDTLHTLNLGGNSVGDRALRQLHSALTGGDGSCSLTQLGLQQCRVGDEGARALAAALAAGACGRLRRVDLRGNLLLTEAGLEWLRVALCENSCDLHQLDLPEYRQLPRYHELYSAIADRCASNRRQHHLTTTTASSASADTHLRLDSQQDSQLAEPAAADAAEADDDDDEHTAFELGSCGRRISLTCELSPTAHGVSQTPSSDSPRRLVSPQPSPVSSPGVSRFQVFRVDSVDVYRAVQQQQQQQRERLRHLSSESEDAFSPPASPSSPARLLPRHSNGHVARHFSLSPARDFLVTPVAESVVRPERA